MARQLTVAELIDYLQQFPGSTAVYLNAADTPNEDTGHIALDVIDFTVEEAPRTYRGPKEGDFGSRF